jgi:hypothetical protein
MDIVQQNLLRKMDGKINGTNGTNGDGRQMTRKMSQVHLFFPCPTLTIRPRYSEAGEKDYDRNHPHHKQ